MPPRILIVQNNLESPAGLLQEEALRRGIEPRVLHGDSALRLPEDAGQHDGLLILGGTMNALADHVCPYFPSLLALARAMDRAHRPVMGICLGAQLLARAWGGRSRIGGAPEYGFVPVRRTDAAAADPLLQAVPDGIAFMQWHDDTFDLPPEASLLMRGTGCANQVWRAGNATWGFQPHIEVTGPILTSWGRLRMELTGDPKAPELLRAATDSHLAAATEAARTIAGRFADLVVQAAKQRQEAA
ncbi:MAG TPA: type 1 glutamine amidotransferase [Geminicoccus sp.]|jgi:GMP synthase-like glutamine amidotransferase|uniref:type 1 glutamine amidotransferase n=1 Tax=Geminicoccus sp. TaxID=2024832 RepID=UPI002E3449F3|nr:type 1 glutamine amidotransferase [Geminicoccus sp.]HEX2527314.1 type 1 glutamine amidotransferase [Geminicoccus sp.]